MSTVPLPSPLLQNLMERAYLCNGPGGRARTVAATDAGVQDQQAPELVPSIGGGVI